MIGADESPSHVLDFYLHTDLPFLPVQNRRELISNTSIYQESDGTSLA